MSTFMYSQHEKFLKSQLEGLKPGESFEYFAKRVYCIDYNFYRVGSLFGNVAKTIENVL